MLTAVARRRWFAAAATVIGALSVVCLLPNTVVASPGVAIRVPAGGGNVIALTVYESTVPFPVALLCQAKNACAALDPVHLPADAPRTAQAASASAASAVSSLLGHDVAIADTLPVSGASAGLALGVSQYLQATGATVPSLVAATGVLTESGKVLPVAAVSAKAQLAKQQHADLLLVPPGSLPLPRYHGAVREVRTLAQAIQAVCELPGSICGDPHQPW